MNNFSETTAFYRMKLPHWEVENGRYFVTIRAYGSIPKVVLDEIKLIRNELEHCEDESIMAKMERHIFRKMEESLHSDRSCDLFINGKTPQIITDAITYYQQQGIWDMHEYVIMPNHIHLFFGDKKESLPKLILNFKHWITSQVNKSTGNVGKQLWQREWFDHWSRSANYDNGFCKYIRMNPVKAGLCKQVEDWPYGSWNNPL